MKRVDGFPRSTGRVRHVVFALMAAAITIGFANAAAAQCPIERMVGQLIRLEDPKGTVWVFRDGGSSRASENMCVLYGDRIEAGTGGRVEISTRQGPVKLGAPFSPTVWTAPKDNSPPAPLSERLNLIYRALTDPLRPPPVAGIGRGDRSCGRKYAETDDDAGQAKLLSPLRALPVTVQRLKPDATLVVVGWTTQGDVGPIVARLIRAGEQAPIALEQTCGRAHAGLRIPKNVLVPGSRFTLQVTTGEATAFEYPILIVDQSERLGAVPESRRGWAYGAWLLADGPPDTRLYALSRVAAEEGTSFGAWRIFTAVISDEKY